MNKTQEQEVADIINGFLNYFEAPQFREQQEVVDKALAFLSTIKK